jgi:hypothetical protein
VILPATRLRAKLYFFFIIFFLFYIRLVTDHCHCLFLHRAMADPVDVDVDNIIERLLEGEMII